MTKPKPHEKHPLFLHHAAGCQKEDHAVPKTLKIRGLKLPKSEEAETTEENKDEPHYSEHYGPYGFDEIRYEDALATPRFMLGLYARLGLHGYNLVNEKKLQFNSVQRFFRPFLGTFFHHYYSIILKAKDDLNCSLQDYKTRVIEKKVGKCMLWCHIARRLGCEYEVQLPQHLLNFEEMMPVLPPENPFIDDHTSRFYLLTTSDLMNNDWIRLYLELAVATTSRHCLKPGLTTHLEILKVAMKITPDNKGLTAFDATFYIRYRDFCKSRVGEDVDRVALVRRILNSELLVFMGHTLSSQLPWHPN